MQFEYIKQRSTEQTEDSGLACFSASERPDLIPIYNFNDQGLWLAKKHYSGRLGGAERLSLWQDLRFRFNQEANAAPMPE